MTRHLRAYGPIQQDEPGAAIRVCVASDQPEKLLGVRDGFERYLEESSGRRRLISVSSALGPFESILPLTDEETVELAWRRARDVRGQVDDDVFSIGCELGVVSARVGSGGERRQLIRCWAVVLGLGREAWGSGGSIQLPNELMQGLDQGPLPFGVPGGRRRGGMISSLTGGLESRRSVASLAVFHALATLFYGLEDERPATPQRPRL